MGRSDDLWAGIKTPPSAAWVDQFVVSYSPDFLMNRGLVILGAAVCLTILHLRFAIAERPERAEKFSVLDLSKGADRVYYSAESLPAKHIDLFDKAESHERVMLPSVATASAGFRTTVKKLIAALSIEFQLLRAERTLIVLVPLAIFDFTAWQLQVLVFRSRTCSFNVNQRKCSGSTVA